MSYVYGSTVPNSQPVEYSSSNQTETEQAGGGETNKSTTSSITVAGVQIPIWVLVLFALIGAAFLLLRLAKR